MLFLALIQENSFLFQLRVWLYSYKGSLERNSNLCVVNVEGTLSQIKISVLCVYGARKKQEQFHFLVLNKENLGPGRLARGPCSAGLRSVLSTLAHGSRSSRRPSLAPRSYIRTANSLWQVYQHISECSDCFANFSCELTWIWRKPLVVTQDQSRTSQQGSLPELLGPAGWGLVSALV